MPRHSTLDETGKVPSEQLPEGVGGGGANLTISYTSTVVTVLSDSGTDATIPGATDSNAGVMVASDKIKLDGVASGATANASDALLRDRATHTGTQAISTVTGLQAELDSSKWTYVFLSTAFTNSTTTNNNSPLTFTPAANSRYEVEIRLYLQSAATTTGARPGIMWPTAGLEQNAAWMISANSATAFASRFWGNTTLANAAATGVPVANEGVWSGGFAMFRTGVSPAGSFVITLASEIAASEARIMENSFIRYRII